MLTKTTSGEQTSNDLQANSQEVRNAQGLVETTTQTVNEDGDQITEVRRDGQLTYTTTTEVSVSGHRQCCSCGAAAWRGNPEPMRTAVAGVVHGCAR